MEREQMKSMLGMNSGGGTSVYKLNKVEINGDTGIFKFTDLTTDREKGSKPNTESLGETLDCVILKMRWKLYRFEESGSFNSTEYDNKWEDTVTVYPSKDKGAVSAMKEKYKLSTQRVIYVYLPAKKEIVRLIVKSSALSDDTNANPEGQFALFGYVDQFANDEILACEVITTCKGVFREGKNGDGSPNKRKDHYAMSFKRGRTLSLDEFAKVEAMMIDVHEKTNTPKPEDNEVPTYNPEEGEVPLEEEPF